ncbi:MAG TPA: MFS transporter [Pseudonocardiaceae bacterium]|nr:MFS transporter [Pseudonocardiaceae bacterium]
MATHAVRTPLRRLPAVTGWSFLAAGFTARLPQAMTPLGVLLLVSAGSGDYGLGGFALAGYSAGCAIGGPVLGSLADRYGHRAVGVAAAVANVAATAMFVLLAGTHAVVAAAALGFANPQIGALARSRWAWLARGRSDGAGLLATAMAYEGSADEMSFVLGPALAGTLSVVAPWLPLVVAAALSGGGQIVFALHPTALPASRSARGRDREPLPWRTVATLGLVFAGIGIVFGATQTGLAAILGADGQRSLTGPVYAALGASSGVAGLLSTLLPARIPVRTKAIGAAALLAVLTLPLPFCHGPVSLAVALGCAGLAVAPLAIAATELAQRSAPARRVTTVLTVLGTVSVTGIALGAGVAGQLADRFGGSAAFVLPTVAALIAIVGALLTRPWGRRITAPRGRSRR